MATISWEVPGRREALAKENQLREEAYLGNPSVVAGVRVRQITPRLMNLLTVIGSAFVVGGTINEAEAIRFLWTLSIDLNPTARLAPWYRSRWTKKYRKFVEKRHDWEYVFDCIDEFMTATFLDAPTGGDESTPYICSTAWIVIRMKDILGWEKERTMDTPLREIYQYLRAEALKQGDRTLVNKLSDKANDDWLKSIADNPEVITEIQRGGIKLN